MASPYYDAVVREDVPAIEALFGADPNRLVAGFIPGTSWLSLAAEHGCLTSCAALLHLGVDINESAPRSGHSVALDQAVRDAPIEVTQWFLNHGASPDGVPMTAVTPLMVAALGSRLAVAKLLLDAGAEINREHLIHPQTATTMSETPAMADFLESRGGIDTYSGFTIWEDGTVGLPQIKLIEAALGIVPPFSFEREQGVVVRRTRFGPNEASRYFQLLFTVNAGSGTGPEVALCLPREWPVNESAMKEHRFRWPVDLLHAIGAALASGATLEHSDVLGRDDKRVGGVEWMAEIHEWHAVRHESIETHRDRIAGARPVLVLIPNLAKTPIRPGKDAKTRADFKAQLKWDASALKGGRNNLALPVPYEVTWPSGRF